MGYSAQLFLQKVKNVNEFQENYDCGELLVTVFEELEETDTGQQYWDKRTDDLLIGFLWKLWDSLVRKNMPVSGCE